MYETIPKGFSYRVQRFAADVVHALVAILAVLVLATTAFIANQDDYSFPNTAALPNAVYYLIAAAVICVLVLTLHEWLAVSMDRRRFYVVVATIAALTAVAELVVSLWIPVELSADFATVRTTALGLASGGTFDTSGNLAYFQRYENNINITILFSWIVQLTGHWRCVVYLGALLVNASVVLAALMLAHITGNRRVAIVVLLVGELLFGVTWRTFIPYSDNYGMVFVAGVLFLYVSDLPARVKVPAIALVGAVGSWVKITVLIAPLAVAVHALIVADWSAARRKSSLMVAGGALAAFALCMGALQLATDALRAHYGFVSDEALAFGIWHFLMMGQNSDYYGMVNSEDVAYTASYATYAERSSANLVEALRRIAERGVLGNIVFYLKKIDVAYLDGLFHNMQSFTSASAVEEVEGTLLGSFYLQDGDLYQIGASAAQVMWDGVLLLLAASAFLSTRDQRDAMPFWILVLGVTLYVLLFEDRSKYLFMFAPGYLVAAGVGLALLLNAVKNHQRTINI